MAFKTLLDANLLLDFTLQRKNYKDAKAIIQKGIDGDLQLFTTPAIIHITSYWLRKAYGTAETKEILISLLETVFVIDCDHATTLLALHSTMNDVEDALQYFTALKYGLNYFISSDKELKRAAMPQLPVYKIQKSF